LRMRGAEITYFHVSHLISLHLGSWFMFLCSQFFCSLAPLLLDSYTHLHSVIEDWSRDVCGGRPLHTSLFFTTERGLVLVLSSRFLLLCQT
jgi:hypothetical protein